MESGNAPTVDFQSRLASVFRFFLTISAALGVSVISHDSQLGGFAALGAFMALLSDTQSTLVSRLGGLAVTFLGVMAAALIGLSLKHFEYGAWVVVGLVCFGQSLLTFAEKFWWLWGKYVLVFLLISVFDFSPNEPAFIGYFLGFSLAGAVITIDHFCRGSGTQKERPLQELRLIEGGNRNSYVYGFVSALSLLVGLWISTRLHLSEPGWVGITIVYLLNADIEKGFKRVIMRILGTLVGYGVVLLLFRFLDIRWFLGSCIVLSSLGIPYFVGKNYGAMSAFITAYILFVLDWLLLAYGGDRSILVWRIWDTLLGAAVASAALSGLWLWYRFGASKVGTKWG